MRARWLGSLRRDAGACLLNAGAVLLVAPLGLDRHVTSGQRATFVAGAAVMLVLLTVAGALREERGKQQLRAIAWRNLDVRGPRPGPLRTSGTVVPQWLVAACVPLFTGGVARLLGAPPAVLVAGVVVTVSVLAALTALSASAWLVSRRTEAPGAVRARLSAALVERQPRVLFYLSGPDDAARNLAERWLPVLEQMPEAVLVVVRSPVLLDTVRTTLPVAFLPRAGDLQPVLPASIRLALYPAHDPRNNHVIRLPGITDVFLDGDVGDVATEGTERDAAAGVSRLVRAFDETWVSGPARRDRYLRAGLLRAEQVRNVGSRAAFAAAVQAAVEDAFDHRPEPAAGFR